MIYHTFMYIIYKFQNSLESSQRAHFIKIKSRNLINLIYWPDAYWNEIKAMNTAKLTNMFTVTTQTSNNDQNKDCRIYV